MPEGDTVWLTARRLDERLSGAPLVRGELRVPAHATASLAGREVLATVSRGKHLLSRFSGGLTLHTHLKMEGAWRLVPAGRRPPRPAHQVRAVLANERWTAVGLRLGLVELLRTSEEGRAVGHLGPDLLGDWSTDAEDEALARLRGAPARAVGAALLDQRNLAGIGTLYRAETLFLTGVSPWRPLGEVASLPAVVRMARRLLLANRERWEQVTTGERADPLWVFQRAGRPCRRCGTPVRHAQQEGRDCYWCPHCQPERP